MADEPASALSPSQWETVRGHIDNYITGQYNAGSEGEAGYIVDQAALKTRIDSSSNGVFLSEGDNAATAPVLVDSAVSQTDLIPGTSARCDWSGGIGTLNCFDTAQVDTVKNRVNAHQAAGFSTDVIVYGDNGNDEAPAAGGFGFLAQPGALGGTTTPDVYAFKWGRDGWTNTSPVGGYLNANATAAAGSTSTYADGANAECGASANDSELVRCMAQWAASTTGGNVGDGMNPPLGGGYQPVDIRAGSPASTISNTLATIQIPVNTLFNTGVNYLDPAASPKKVFAGRTQHVAGITAMGAEMLGYDSTFMKYGMPNWNNTMAEQWVSTGNSYEVLAVSSNNLTSGVDVTAPIILIDPTATSTTATSATITRTANEAATMKIEYGTTSGVYTTTVNNTVLNAVKSVPLSGLTEYTTYYVKVTSYDGQANGTVSSEFSFTTADVTNPSITNLLPSGNVYSGSTTISADYSDGGSGINSSTAKIFLDGSATALTGCTATGTGISCPVTGLALGAHTFSVEVKDQADNTGTNGTGSFTVADNVAPAVTYSGPTGTITTTGTTITGTYTDAAPSSGVNTGSATVSIDAGAPQACSAAAGSISCTVAGLTQGAHSAVISISDNDANTGSNTPAGSFTVDTTAPSISNLLPTGTVYSGSPTISADYSDATSGIDSTTAKIFLDGSATALTGCTATGTGISCPVTGLAYGAHTFSVEVKDNVANTATNAGGSFTVADNVAPVVTYSGPTGTITTTGTTITGTYTDAAPSSGVNTASATVSIDAGAPTACTAAAGSISCTVAGLAQGAHLAVISISDNDANTGSNTPAGSFTVDTTAPSISNLLPTGTVYSGSPTISADYSDATSGIDSTTAKIFLDGSATALTGCTATGTGISCPVTGLAYGAHTFSVEVKDNVANTATNAGGSFTVGDNVAPAVTYSGPTGTITTTGTTITGTYTDAAPSSGLNTGSATVSIDAGAPQACTAAAGSISCTVAGLAQGAHLAVISISDNDANTGSNTPAGSFTVDSVVPSISNLLPTGTVYSGSPTISADYSDATSGIDSTTAKIFLDGSATALTGCTATGTGISCPVTGLAYGAHTFSVEVKDNVANTATNGTGSFTVGDNVAPAVTYSGPTGTITTTGTTITGTYTDAAPSSGVNTTSATVSIDAGAPQACSAAAGSISCTVAGLTQGAHSAVISISDNDANTGSNSPAGSFTVDSVAPSITNLAPTGTIYTASTTISADYTDATSGIDSTTAKIFLDGSATALTGCTATGTGISCPVTGLAYGAHTFSVEVKDNVANTATNGTGAFTVGDNVAPTVSNVTPSGWINSTGPTIEADLADNISGINTATASISLDGGPALTGCTVTTSHISCPSSGLAVGSHTIAVSVNDNAGNNGTGSGSFSIDTTLPVISNVLPIGTIYTGSTTISANYSDASSGINTTTANIYLDGSVTALTGCTISGSGISCPVTGLAVGAHTFTVRVTDNAGNIRTNTDGAFTVADNVAPAVTYSGPTGTITTSGTTITGTYTDAAPSSGVNTATATVSIDAGAPQACTAAAGSISCSVSGLADGAHSAVISISDNAANTGSSSAGSFTVDTTAPSITNLAPSGTIYTNTTTISADYSDATSGIDSSTAKVFLDGSATALTGCTATGTGISCPVTGLAYGAHTFSVEVKDNVANTATNGTGSFTVGDNVAPAVTYSGPTGTITTASPTITGTYTDAAPSSGVNTGSATVSIDAGAPQACSAAAGSISCSVAGLAQGAHSAVISISDNDANTGSSSAGSFTVDTVAPSITGLAPTGTVYNGAPTISANYTDATSGINSATAKIFLDGSATALTGCTATGTSISCPATGLALGNHTFTVEVKDNVNNTATNTGGSFTVEERSYFFTWYDDNAGWGMNGNWLLINNEDATAATVDIFVDDMVTPVANDVPVPAGSSYQWTAPGTVTGGFVKVVSTNGEVLGVSQRVIYKDSFNEIEAVPGSSLGKEYYFPWYDNNASWGMNGNWVHVANTTGTATTVDIYVGDMTTPKANDVPVAANDLIAWQSPTTLTDGPVKVVGANAGDKLVVSQRVIYKDSFNEAIGIGSTTVANEAWFTWYDNNAGWGMNGNWVCVANMGGAATNVDIFIGGTEVASNLPVGANGGHVEWQSPTTLTGGPVRVVGANGGDQLVVSQRVIYKASFEETAPTYLAQMGSNADFSWYDNNALYGMNGNWVHATNADSTPAAVSIAINGVPYGSMAGVAANGGQGNWTSSTTVTNGPVRVTNTGSSKLVISQRVIYKNSFNELVGRPR